MAVCVICAAAEPEYWSGPRGLPYDLMRCPACGHIAVPPSARSLAQNLAIQSEAFDATFAARSGFFVNFYEQINCRRTIRALRVPERSQVLEVGPGSGSLMAALAKRGHNVTGLDLSPAIAEGIEGSYGLRVVIGAASEHAKTEPGQYDAVVIRHTLEHIYDPNATLRDIHTLLKPAGILYVALPNMDSWHRAFAGWFGYELSHVHYFNRNSLRVALQRAGFEVIHSETYESLAGWSNSLFRSLPGVGRRIGRAFPPTASAHGSPGVARSAVRVTLEIARCAVGLLSSPLRWTQAVLGKGEELVMVGRRR